MASKWGGGVTVLQRCIGHWCRHMGTVVVSVVLQHYTPKANKHSHLVNRCYHNKNKWKDTFKKSSCKIKFFIMIVSYYFLFLLHGDTLSFTCLKEKGPQFSVFPGSNNEYIWYQNMFLFCAFPCHKKRHFSCFRLGSHSVLLVVGMQRVASGSGTLKTTTKKENIPHEKMYQKSFKCGNSFV